MSQAVRCGGGLGSLAILTLAAASQSLPEKFDLVWRPRPRQVLRYRLAMHVDLPGSKLSVTADLVQTVGRPDKNGTYTVSTATKNVRTLTGGAPETMPDEAPSVEKYDSKGRRLSQADDASDWFANNLGHCTDFVPPPKPIQVGDKWSSPVKAGGGLLAGRLDYRLADIALRSKVRLLHVKYAFGETFAREPVHGEGFFYLDPRDFSVVESEAVVHNVRISPDLPQSPTVEVQLVRE